MMTTSQSVDATTDSARPVVTAAGQADLPADRILHSGNAGLLIHRRASFRYEYAEEGYGYGMDLVKYLNTKQIGGATTFCYEEALGVRDQVHWLIHLRSLDQYKKLIHAVDHDRDLMDISIVDRLPEKGHGNWEKIFVESSISERVMVPQHGFDQFPNAPYDPDEYFAAPAQNQTQQALDQQITSATAGAVILRTGKAKYEFREEARLYWYDWQEYVNRELAGLATCYTFEQTFGQQDTVHMLIHLRELGDYRALSDLDRSSGMRDRIHTKQRIHDSKGGGTWEKLFLDGSISDTVLVPRAPKA